MINKNFKRIEFDAFRNEDGSNSFALTPQKWIEATQAIGIVFKSGRYGGINYHIHTDAIKANLIPPELTKQQISFV